MSDADKIITLITEDIGKVSVWCGGRERTTAIPMERRYLLTASSYCSRGRNNYILNGCDILASFYDLANDLERFTYAAHMIEMASDASSDDQTTARVLNLLLHGLNALNKGREPLLVSSAFTIKLMQICGYPPHVTSCASCDEKDFESIYFCFSRCGFVCENCARTNKDAVPVTIGTAKAILHVLCSDNPGVFKFRLSPGNLESFSYIANRYIAERFDKKYGKLDYLKEISQVSYHLGGNDS